MAVLVTGAAGFIGFHASMALLARGEAVVGVDDLNPYYEPSLKRDRLQFLLDSPAFRFHQINVADKTAMLGLADANPEIDAVLHLAAQAGVRHSLTHPYSYVD